MKNEHKRTSIKLLKHLKYYEFNLCHGKMSSKDFKNFSYPFNSQSDMALSIASSYNEVNSSLKKLLSFFINY